MSYSFSYSKNIFIHLVKLTLYYISTSLLGWREDLIILKTNTLKFIFLAYLIIKVTIYKKLKFIGQLKEPYSLKIKETLGLKNICSIVLISIFIAFYYQNHFKRLSCKWRSYIKDNIDIYSHDK